MQCLHMNKYKITGALFLAVLPMSYNLHVTTRFYDDLIQWYEIVFTCDGEKHW